MAGCCFHKMHEMCKQDDMKEDPGRVCRPEACARAISYAKGRQDLAATI